MCPPYFRAHPQVRPYENIENYTWETTLVSCSIICMAIILPGSTKSAFKVPLS
jgi:hypothetical protein